MGKFTTDIAKVGHRSVTVCCVPFEYKSFEYSLKFNEGRLNKLDMCLAYIHCIYDMHIRT